MICYPVNMAKYETSTFLAGLFYKFRVRDKRIRKVITNLYGDLIGTILAKTSHEKCIVLFKLLVPTIKDTIEYLEQRKDSDISADVELLQVFSKFVVSCTHVVNTIGIRDDANTHVFDNIMKHTFIDEIACDIGDCVKSFKENPKDIDKKDIIAQLTVKLADYNAVMLTNLTLTSVLYGEEAR